MPQTRPKVLICALCLILSLCLFGCSDRPETEAAKELYDSIDKALQMAEGRDGDDIVDVAERLNRYAGARQMVKEALAKNAAKAGKAQNPAWVASGDMAYAQAVLIGDYLQAYSQPLNKNIDKLAEVVEYARRLEREKNQIERLLEVADTQIMQLKAILEGGTVAESVAYGGLAGQLSAQEQELAELEKTEASLQEKLADFKKQENDLNSRAQEYLRQAETTGNDEKIALQQKAYELLLARKERLEKTLQLEQRIESVDNEIITATAVVEKLRLDFDRITEQINSLQGSESTLQLRQYLDSVASQTADYEGQTGQIVDAISSLQQKYDDVVSRAVGLFENEAAADFGRVLSGDLAPAAAAQAADCHMQAANTYVTAMLSTEYAGARLNLLAAGSSQSLNIKPVGQLAQRCLDRSEQYNKKAMEKFDSALETYQKLDRFNAGREFAAEATKSQLLALFGKKFLADRLEDDTITGQLDTAIKELQGKAGQLDPSFSKSALAGMVRGQGYIADMAVDNTAVYENIRKQQFQAWKNLKIQEQEAEVKRLLELIGQLKEQYQDEAFDRTIEPEKRELEAALARGFEPTSVPAAVSGGDPNYR